MQTEYNREIKINVLECVPVIQGEGRSTGSPMVLIRLAGCNLNCIFSESICDASETSWLFNSTTAKKWSLDEIDEVLKANPHIHKVMITGGNPTLNKSLFLSVLQVCRENYKLVEIEDNGTTFIAGLTSDDINLVSMSPKLANSIPVPGLFVKELGRETNESDRKFHLKNYRNVESMSKWVKDFDYQIKFVISNEGQIEEALDLVKAIGANIENVYFMPEGMTKLQLEGRRRWLYETCLKLGVNYTDRLHILVYDDKKGV
jgi:7-carboxy-7-deazaguanine synthase